MQVVPHNTKDALVQLMETCPIICITISLFIFQHIFKFSTVAFTAEFQAAGNSSLADTLFCTQNKEDKVVPCSIGRLCPLSLLSVCVCLCVFSNLTVQ